ncbi:ADM_HP2_G0024820.mRNA.1.CDS.1 [Saccharomyces cerevisiae]|nr:ADM_HP2_G0024820.mRNA.1.CDS.1 [Saccharomyces cerevisiae]CAI6450681.1 ADM_HP2_G0024820.mRNA.1.CDS.1 [Saccharomyces cerevisiae]
MANLFTLKLFLGCHRICTQSKDSSIFLAPGNCHEIHKPMSLVQPGVLALGYKYTTLLFSVIFFKEIESLSSFKKDSNQELENRLSLISLTSDTTCPL